MSSAEVTEVKEVQQPFRGILQTLEDGPGVLGSQEFSVRGQQVRKIEDAGVHCPCDHLSFFIRLVEPGSLRGAGIRRGRRALGERLPDLGLLWLLWLLWLLGPGLLLASSLAPVALFIKP